MKYSILVADDDDDDFMLLATHIQSCHQGIDLTYAQNGLEATQKLNEGLQPNLILIDVHMPLMNGYELVNWVMNHDSFRQIPMVVWTGELSTTEVTRFYLAGANSVILKQDALRGLGAFCQHWFELVQLPLALPAA